MKKSMHLLLVVALALPLAGCLRQRFD